MIRRAVIACALSLLVAPAELHADTSDAARKEQARLLFERGTDLAAKGRWKEALEAFDRSGALLDHASIHYNVGFCERALGRVTRARKSLRTALARDAKSGGTELSTSEREFANALAAELEAKLARLELSVRPPNMQIAIDGRPLELDQSGGYVAGVRAPGPPQSLGMDTAVVLADPGGHAIVAVDGQARTHRFDVMLGERETIRLLIEEPPPYWEEHRVSALVLGGVALGAAGVALGLTVKAAESQAAAEAACPLRTRCPDGVAAERSRDAIVEANVATAGYVIAGAAAATGAIVWLTAPEGPAAISVGATGVRVNGVF